MIRDFNEYADDAVVNADVCIVGGGAVGIAVAKELLATGRTILLLEAGGVVPEAATQRLYDAQVVGLPHRGVHSGRARTLGGTTTMWGGQTLRFTASDFRMRSWIPYSGWPISRAELDPYYDRAEALLGLGSPISYGSLCDAHKIAPASFDPAMLCVDCSQWSPKPNFADRFGAELRRAPNLTVLLHANVTELVTHPDGLAVDRIEFSSLDCKHGTARARVYVICCGGIETARLLLASDRIQPAIGNQHDLVGRFFQDHLHIDFGDFVSADRSVLRNLYESFYWQGVKHTPKVILSEDLQEREQLLSIQGEVVFESLDDSGIAELKQIVRAFLGRASWPSPKPSVILKLLRDPLEMLRLGYRIGFQGRVGSSKGGRIHMGAQCETAPNANSRLTLSEARDHLGMRRVNLDWRLGELERRTLEVFFDAISAEFRRLELASTARAGTHLSTTDWLQLASDAAHHMGTTRMHDSPRLGVVDRNCRVHGVDNLYIAGCSVFPTSARSNPTLTALALSLRLTDGLKQLYFKTPTAE